MYPQMEKILPHFYSLYILRTEVLNFNQVQTNAFLWLVLLIPCLEIFVYPEVMKICLFF